MLRKKHMVLDSYDCELCLLQRQETLCHLVLNARLQEIAGIRLV
jgi:hypothetical protein